MKGIRSDMKGTQIGMKKKEKKEKKRAEKKTIESIHTPHIYIFISSYALVYPISE
jgi:hypothetical protein